MASREDRAVLEGFGEILVDLVSKHATQRQWNEWLKVPLELGLRRGDSDLVSRLLVAGSVAREGSSGKDSHPLLLTAFAERDHDKGGPAGFPSQGSQRRAHGGADGASAGGASNDAPPSSLLHSAIRQGDADMVSELLRKGADVDMLDFDGRSPLRVAVSACSLPVVKVLLDEGAGASAALLGEDGRCVCVSPFGSGPQFVEFYHALTRAYFRRIRQCWLLREEVHARTVLTYVDLQSLSSVPLPSSLPPPSDTS